MTLKRAFMLMTMSILTGLTLSLGVIILFSIEKYYFWIGSSVTMVTSYFINKLFPKKEKKIKKKKKEEEK